MSNNLRNPVMLARRIEAAEQALHRQIVLNAAAADKLIALQEELAAKGSYIIALVKKHGGRVELPVTELQEIASSSMKVHYSFPTEERPSFLMVLSASSADDDDEPTRITVEKLRAAGLSDEEISGLRAAGELQAAGELIDRHATPLEGGAETPTPAGPGESAIVGPDGKPPQTS